MTLLARIEHLQPADLPALSKSIFGDLCPAMCLVTTPNKDFNPLFSDKPTLPPHTHSHTHTMGRGQMVHLAVCSFIRHSDHKFEWTRQEFQVTKARTRANVRMPTLVCVCVCLSVWR